MAIKASRQPPASGRMTVMQAINDLAPRETALGGGRLDISQPLPIFRVDLNDLTDEDGLDHAKFVAWRYLIEGIGSGAGMADIGERPGGLTYFGSLARNEQAEFLLQGAHIAQAEADRTNQDCEARILLVPSLYVTALWLTTTPPVFIPILDAENPIRDASEVKVQPNFLSRIVARARKRHRPSKTSTSSMSGP